MNSRRVGTSLTLLCPPYDYWADGQLKSVTDALTNTTHFEYDEAGHQKLVRDALRYYPPP